MSTQSLTYKTERTNIDNFILLDANEHYKQWVKIPGNALTSLNRYPDKTALKLRTSLAKSYCGPLSPENIFVSSGSIEAIDLLIQSCRPQTIMINTPSYDVYSLRATAHSVKTISIPLFSNGQPDVNSLLANTNNKDMIILINPNNPTGELLDRTTIKHLLDNFTGILIIDEAYIEYSGLEHSMQNLIRSHNNIVIIRTFSKAWGLAGVRLGYVLGNSNIINRLQAFQNPYSVSTVALAAGLAALEQINGLPRHVQRTIRAKNEMLDKLKKIGVNATNTDANFILIPCNDAYEISAALKSEGVLVRPRILPQSKNSFLRVTVGSPHENRKFIEALSRINQ